MASAAEQEATWRTTTNMPRPGQAQGAFKQYRSTAATTNTDLYNKHEDGDELEKLGEELEATIDENSMKDVDEITLEVVRDVSAKLRKSKTDPVFAYSSNCYKQAPDILYELLAGIFQSFLVHSHVTAVLLVAVLVPIIKNQLGSVTSSKNYRSIAISSILLKLLDWITLLLHGEGGERQQIPQAPRVVGPPSVR